MATYINEPEGKLGDSFLIKEDDNDYILQENGDKLIIYEDVSYTNESEA